MREIFELKKRKGKKHYPSFKEHWKNNKIIKCSFFFSIYLSTKRYNIIIKNEVVLKFIIRKVRKGMKV